MRLSRPICTLVLSLVLLSAACGDDTDGGSTAATTTAPTTTAPATTSASPGPLRDVRYCEVLTIDTSAASGDGLVEAGVWNTLGLNDCPDQPFGDIDLEQTAADLDVTAAVLNGPRHWVLDEIEQVSQSTEDAGRIHDFGDIEMRLVATVSVNPNRMPYTETTVARDTVFTFSAGREVPTLTAPDDTWYVMQSYSLEVDPELTLADLPTVGNAIDVPEGWTFEMRTLDEDLDVGSAGGTATVIQDDLQNTYQRVDQP